MVYEGFVLCFCLPGEVWECARGWISLPGWRVLHACAQAKDFIKRLLVVDAGARMSMAEALQHPWLAHVTLAPIPSSICDSAGL